MSGRDRIEGNAFRILRLSGRSKCSEIHGAAASLRRAAALGLSGMTQADLPKVRAAVGILSKPRQRIEHRLFWFYDTNSQESGSTPALDGSETHHDFALRSLMTAYSSKINQTSAMHSALRQWHGFVSQQGYWDVLSRIECEGDCEPAAIREEVSDLRKGHGLGRGAV
jgi:hypothetical protein